MLLINRRYQHNLVAKNQNQTKQKQNKTKHITIRNKKTKWLTNDVYKLRPATGMSRYCPQAHFPVKTRVKHAAMVTTSLVNKLLELLVLHEELVVYHPRVEELPGKQREADVLEDVADELYPIAEVVLYPAKSSVVNLLFFGNV